jgi:ankyrin repeat domain-containing protein 50
VKEVSEVVAINVERDPMFDRQEVLEDPLESLNICSSLVSLATVDESNRRAWNDQSGSARQIIVLAHYSVKEYLVSERSRKGRAARYSMQDADCNEIIAKSCLGYLLQFQQSESFSSESIEEFQLARYSAEFGFGHAQAAVKQTETVSRLIMKLFSIRNGAYLNWIRIYDPDQPWQGVRFDRVLKRIPTPLYYASYAGLIEVVKLLLDESADVNAHGGRLGNALQAASARGHQQVVKLLLDEGADVNAQGRLYGNALYAASGGGHQQVVKLLLDEGADVNAHGGRHGNALQAASGGGHQQVVKLLLDEGADVNAQGGFHSNALQAASAGGHKQVVKLLLENGADINAQDGSYGNTL